MIGKIITLIWAAFSTLFFIVPAAAQQPVVKPGNYFAVYSSILYEQKQIPGFIQEIPVEFKDIVSLHTTGIDARISTINKMIGNTENALAITPENDILMFKLAILYYERKDYVKAEKMFENLVNRSAKRKIDEDASYYLGLIAAQRKAYKECKYYFEEVLRLNKRRLNGYVNLGISFFYLGNYNKSREQFETALILQPEDPISYFYKGLINYKSGKTKTAVAEFRWADRLKPNDPIFEKWTDSIMEDDGRIPMYLLAIETKPEEARNYVELGLVYVEYGELALAQTYLDKALAMKKNDRSDRAWIIDAYDGLSEVYLFKKQFDRAQSIILKIFEYSHSAEAESFVYSAIGRIWFHAQKYDRAEEYIRKALEKSQPKKDYYSRALLGQLYILQDKLEDAEDELVKCRSSGVKHPEIDELEMKIARYKRLNE